MMNRKRKARIANLVGKIFIILLFLVMIVNVIVPDRKESELENRALESRPRFNLTTILSGDFMEQWEEYLSDQFVGRDTWRGVKVGLDRLGGARMENNIYIGKDLVGSFGEVNPKYYKEGYILGELNLTKLFAVQVSKLKCKPLSNLQPIRRDIALKLLSNDVKNEQIVSEIKRLGGKYVQSVEIFDVFTKDNETSYAYAIYLLKEDKSFLDSEIAQIMNNIITGLQNKLKVELKS